MPCRRRLGSFYCYVMHNKYPLYVLTVLMLTYLVNQLNACEAPEPGWNTSVCYLRYLGGGLHYQLLAGPLYIVCFSISALPLGMVSELNNINRKIMLVPCAMLWSAMTIIGGFSTQYWHLAITRILMGVFSAACVPFCASIISDYFCQESVGAALGFYNWGVYVGYSVTYLLLMVERRMGWRAVYFIAGFPGLVLGLILLVTVREPVRGATGPRPKEALGQLTGTWGKLKTTMSCFSNPALILLCLGGAIRNGAGFIGAYNVIIFFNRYHPETKVEKWMSWKPLIFGSLAAILGGIISDRAAGSRGTAGRLIVLIVCTGVAAPFLVGVLYAPTATGAFLCLIPGYISGEMWIGVCGAVVLELVPVDLRTSSLALYFFVIQIVGGNMPLLVAPLTRALDLRRALLVCNLGFYWAAALCFALALIVVRSQQRRAHEVDDELGRRRRRELSTAISTRSLRNSISSLAISHRDNHGPLYNNCPLHTDLPRR